MKDKFQYDYYRMTGKRFSWGGVITILSDASVRYMYCHRKITEKDSRNFFIRMARKSLIKKNGLEILSPDIGAGLYIGHPFGININESAIIGENCNIHKGVTIGQENRGKRKGSPIIGNNVWIGVNATVVGKVHIGDDVLIAPNSYVNCDIPSHSVVFGNPCKVKYSENATVGYINRID